MHLPDRYARHGATYNALGFYLLSHIYGGSDGGLCQQACDAFRRAEEVGGEGVPEIAARGLAVASRRMALVLTKLRSVGSDGSKSNSQAITQVTTKCVIIPMGPRRLRAPTRVKPLNFINKNNTNQHRRHYKEAALHGN